jgi:hypothetical protein
MTWRLPRILACLFLLSAAGCSSGNKTHIGTYDCCENGLVSVCKCADDAPSCGPGPAFRTTGGGTCTTAPEPDAGPDVMEEPPDLPPAPPRDVAPPSPDLASDTTCSVSARDAEDSCPRDARIH